MQTTAKQDNLHKIVILNPKGGCGKTTLAINLASYFARRGPPPTLVDRDPGGYSMRWLEQRSAELPKVHGVADYEDAHFERPSRVWPDSKELVVDLPAATGRDQLFHEIYGAGSVLIPIVPSDIDIRSAATFIAELLLVAQFDRRNRNLGIVANRVRARTRSYQRLMRFLRSLQIPIVGELRDSQNYVYAAANGIGISEMPAYRVGQDTEQFEPIVQWLDRWRQRRFDAMVAETFRPPREPDVVDTKLSGDTA